jgi:hypothetical protein
MRRAARLHHVSPFARCVFEIFLDIIEYIFYYMSHTAGLYFLFIVLLSGTGATAAVMMRRLRKAKQPRATVGRIAKIRNTIKGRTT